MLKKIMLGIVATVMLIGAENLNSQETQDRPKEEPKQEQSPQGRQRQKDRVQQFRRQRADREAAREDMENLRDEPRPYEKERGEAEPIRPEQEQIAQPGQMFGRLLDELTKAYREDNREKMGQLLRKMNQLRQKWQMVKGRGFQGRGMVGGLGRGLRCRGMTGGWGQGFQGRGMIGGWGRGFQGRGMGGWGWGLRGRGFNRQGPDIPQPPFMEKPKLDEDVDRPGPPMPPRDMSGWGQSPSEP